MKRIYIALILLTAVTALCVGTHRYQHAQMDRMLEALDRVEYACRRGDTAYALSAAHQFANEYRQVSDRVSCYVAHSELDGSQEAAALLPALVAGGASEELYMEMARLRSQLLHIAQIDDPILRNIL